MTRINCVPPDELSDQHLMAEYRELPRVFTLVDNRFKSYKPMLEDNFPKNYVLGQGHVKFFFDKLYYLMTRHKKLYRELRIRDFNVQPIEFNKRLPRMLFNPWTPYEQDMELNRRRIIERISEKPHVYRWTKREIPNYVLNISGFQPKIIN